MPRLLAVMGSGETAPTMIKPHRALFQRLPPDPVPAVLLDTPYGFQENADDISARAVDYFAQSVGRHVDVARLRRREADDPVARERALSLVAAARWTFAGPGSPTYALRQWRGSEVPALLADKLQHGGCMVFASAAALTLGRYSVPVYEVYKSGEDPFWADGLDLVAPALGPDVAVIPHYDNAEGGNHDTRYCYLGDRRLRLLEEQLPAGGWVLGVDEHTGLVLDLDEGTATVVGIGMVTVRKRGTSSTLGAGATVTIDELVSMSEGTGSSAATAPVPPAGADAVSPDTGGDATFLHKEVRRLSDAFDAAVAATDVDGAVRTALELDATLVDWAGDTTQSDAPERGRAALRRMIARLGELAHEGVRDPRTIVGPFVDALLSLRASARDDRRFEDADKVRDALVGAGVEVRDTHEGTSWELA